MDLSANTVRLLRRVLSGRALEALAADLAAAGSLDWESGVAGPDLSTLPGYDEGAAELVGPFNGLKIGPDTTDFPEAGAVVAVNFHIDGAEGVQFFLASPDNETLQVGEAYAAGYGTHSQVVPPGSALQVQAGADVHVQNIAWVPLA